MRSRSSTSPSAARPGSEAADVAGVSGAHSLRLRLPLLLGTVVVLAVGTILWASHREVEETLVAVGRERATEAAEQIADVLERGVGAQRDAMSEIRGDAAIRAFLLDPRAAHEDSVRTAHTPSRPLRRFEVWSADGILLLEIATPRADSAAGPRFLPAGAPPEREGLSELKAAGETNFFELVTEVREDASPGAGRLGWVRQFGSITSSGLRISDLFGTEAALKVGSTEGGVWTDLDSIVPPPPGLDGTKHALRSSGEAWVAGQQPVPGSPWTVWAGFPRELIVAPAASFTREMTLLGFAFLASGMLFTAFFATHLTEPLHGLTRAASTLAAGDFSRRVVTRRRDEIGRLSEAFNRMADQIDETTRALSRSYDDTHFALAAAGIGVWEVELASGRMTCAPSVRQVFGMDDGELPTTREEFLALLHTDDRDGVRAYLEGRVPGGETFAIDCRAVGPGGAVRWIEGKGRIKADERGRPVTIHGISMDVTERRRLESQLRQAQKMEAIGRLAGGVAHDFNNLLTSIVVHSSLLLEDLPEHDRVRDDVSEILRAGKSAAGLTRQLLTFSRRQVVNPQVVDVNESIDNAAKLLRRLIPANIEFVVRTSPDVPRVNIDPSELEQVIMNLCINARDAMPAGGTLTISTAEAQMEGRYAQDGAKILPGLYALLAVNDTGIGMGPETTARLFEPFFTTKPRGKGTGLGLATVFGIVKKSGGHIHVYSEVDHGTTFRVYVPATVEHATQPRIDPGARKPSASGATVLVVEDDEQVRRVAAKVLERSGCRVLVASCGEEALELLAETDVRPDLVVSDVVMPGITGPELGRVLQARYPGLRVLFTSGYSETDLGRRGLEEQGVPFLEKPYTPSQLTDKVRETLSLPAPS